MNLTKLIAEQVAQPDTLLFSVKVNGKYKSIPVLSVADAAAKWNEYRDASMKGVSELGNGGIVHGTKNGRGCHVVAKISYNGRIWE